MSLSDSVCSRKDLLFSSSFFETIRAINITDRVCSLYSSLSKLKTKEKQELSAFLRSIFTEITQFSEISLLHSFKDSLSLKIREKAPALTEKVNALYIQTLQGSDSKEIQDLGHSYLHDLAGVVFNPLKSSTNGAKDPVLLVSLPRPTAISKRDAYEYVIKQTLPEEYLCHILMQKISECLNGFQVPSACAFCDDRHITASLNDIQAEEVRSVQSSFDHLFAGTEKSLQEVHDNRWMTLFDKIPGVSLRLLGDRVYREDIAPYPDQQYRLFRQMAQIAALDLFFGNQDRWNLVDFFESPAFTIQPPSCNNLDNILIIPPQFHTTFDFSDESLDAKIIERPLMLYAIDNGITGMGDVDLIKNPDLRGPYNQCLRDFFKDASSLERLSETLIGSCCLLREEGALEMMLQDLVSTSSPLSAKAIFIETFAETFRAIPEIWDSEYLSSIKGLMAATEPQLLEMFEERIPIFREIDQTK